MSNRLLLLFLVTSACAFEWPFAWSFQIPWLSGKPGQLVLEGTAESTPRVVRPARIAIIGAGAAGSSAAYFASLAKTRSNLTFDIDVYERADYIGGRSTIVFPYGNTELPHIELGGSIFVEANKNMMRATKEFGLEKVDSDFNYKGELGIWDGQQFVFRTETSGIGSWWGKLGALWRYGYSAPTKVDSIVKNMLHHFLKLYNHDFGTWKDIPSVVAQVKLLDVVAQTGAEYFDTQGVGLKFSRELIDAASRVNYGQNLEHIHGFGALVSMSADQASTVVSGNRAIFENFIKASGANILLNTTVTKLSKSTKPLEWHLSTSDGLSLEYDAVIVAAPLPFANLQFKPALKTNVPKIPYVHLHVTLLTTTAKHANS
ncbi:FAD/NAD(P)-binding domain-containing protein, partial [Exidia glandulosa HHB12029]